MSPEAAPVLSDAPTLGVEAAGVQSRVQCLSRMTGCLILGSVEAGKLLPEDLFGLVADDQFGGGGPLPHAAVEVEDAEGVIGYVPDEITKGTVLDRCDRTAPVIARTKSPLGRVGDRIMLHRDEPLALT